MQNPGQTWMFYKTGQTHLTGTKHDTDDQTRFQSSILNQGAPIMRAQKSQYIWACVVT